MSFLDDSTDYNRYFYANVTNLGFDQTSYGVFHRINNWAAFAVGMISIGLFFYMIRYKTPQAFRAYSKLFCLCLLIDFYCLVLFVSAQSRHKVSSVYSVTAFDGPVSLLNRSGQCFFSHFHFLIPQIQCLELPIIAVYRYQHIKNKTPPTIRQLLVYISIATIPLIFSVLSTGLDECTSQLIDVEIIQSWSAETPLPKSFIVVNFTNRYAVIGFMYRRIVSYGSFALTICISIASVRLLRREWPTLNEKTRKVQWTFTKILIATAMIPFVSVVLPIILVAVSILIRTSLNITELAFLIMTWSVPLNCLCSLLIVAPYRRELGRIFSCCSSKSTNPTNMTMFSTSRY